MGRMTIDELLSQPEDKTLEFKRSLTSPKNFLKTPVAFANTAGGKVLIGVEDGARKPVGVEHPLDEEERICNLIADSISPRLVPDVKMATVGGKTLLVVQVHLSGSRPHFINSEGADQGVYVRLGSTNRKADRELIAELRRSAEGVAFDEMPSMDASVDDLDLSSLEALSTAPKARRESELLTLRILRREQGKLVPTRGGVLLFSKNRTQHFPDAWVQCGRFVGRDKGRIFDHTELHGPLPESVDNILLFLKKHAMRGADLTGVRRRDVWSIPLGILREVVINALVHADYSQRGGPTRVAFFDDRIEVENPGILLPGMTVQDMKDGVSKIRNPVIARVFRELKLIEQWGSGVRRIFQEAADLGLKQPEIIEIGMRVRDTVPLMHPISVASYPAVGIVVPTPEVAPEVRVAEVLSGDMSRRAIQNALGLKDNEHFRKAFLAPALEHGLIEMTLPDKPNSRLQKYRLTPKARRLLGKHGGSAKRGDAKGKS